MVKKNILFPIILAPKAKGFLVLLLSAVLFSLCYILPSNASAVDIAYSNDYFNPTRTFLISVPKNWLRSDQNLLNEDVSFINLEGGTLNIFSMYPESDNSSRLTRSVGVEYGNVMDFFSPPSFLRSKISNDDLVNLYIDDEFRTGIRFKVLSTSVKNINGSSVYEVESETLHHDKLFYRKIERFLFQGDQVYYIFGSYISREAQYRDFVLSVMNTFKILKK
ncbi:MAG: hypothetical protein UX89_C0003G0046 [Parcubacteria group bacterium GW2011_GWA2_47_16]|nr:MAG: hypothetical protein UX89_C0003G0046 [Parcubacteria group bacterium GW2011_GWA2_47_16]